MTKCSLPECSGAINCKGLCLKHYQALYRLRNKEKLDVYFKKYYKRHQQQKKLYALAYHYQNLDKIKLRSAEYYLKHREERKRKSREWAKSNPVKRENMKANYRAKVLGAEGFHSYGEIKNLRKEQDDCCAICGIKLNGKYHRDHIRPISKGGSNWINNIQLLCGPCNCKKNAKWP